MINESNIREYLDLTSKGFSQRQACSILGLTRSSVQKALQKNKNTTVNTAILKPVIKSIDIETSPSLGAVFGRFDQNLSQDNIVSEGGRILTACVKTLGEDEVRRYFITDPKERFNGDDSEVVTALWHEINSANIIVGHKVKTFDLATLKARLVHFQLTALPSVQIADTLNMARKLRFNGNSLDSLCAYLGIGRKTKHSGIKLWLDVMHGNEEALAEMLEYNEQDVRLTEEAFLRLLPHVNNVPNIALYFDDGHQHCTTCGSTELVPTGRVVNTGLSSFEEVECTNCGHRMRTRKNTLSKETRKVMLTNVAG